jgi:hypothetical protein
MASRDSRAQARNSKLYLIDLTLDGTYATKRPTPTRVSIGGAIDDSEALLVRKLIDHLRGEAVTINSPDEEAAVLLALKHVLSADQRERLASALVRERK